MKIAYKIIATLSGLLALDTVLGFVGYSPFGGTGILIDHTHHWPQFFTASVVLCGLCIALSAKDKTASFTSKVGYRLLLTLGIMLILGAIPAGIMLELGVNGCCGAPSTGHEGIGIVLFAGMLLVGIVAVVIGVRKLRRPL